ncbi:MAG: hypothetical protein ABIG98_07350 [Chloroflexota bacterium]
MARVLCLILLVALIVSLSPPSAQAQSEGPVEAVVVGEIEGKTYAFLSSNRRVEVLDLSHPPRPARVGQTATSKGPVRGLFLQGHLLFVAAGMVGLRVVDVSNPAQAKEAGVYYPGAAKRTRTE